MIGNSLAYAATACLFFAIGGCAVFDGSVYEAREYPEVTEPTREDREYRQESESEPAISKQSNPAVAALIGQSREYSANEEFQKAASALERAQRIDPKDPEVYAELAVVMLAQELPDEAVNLAQRSNSLAGKKNNALQARNWMTISKAKRARGENAAADAAERRAKQIRGGSN